METNEEKDAKLNQAIIEIQSLLENANFTIAQRIYILECLKHDIINENTIVEGWKWNTGEKKNTTLNQNKIHG